MWLVGTLHGLNSTLRGARSILKRAGEVKPAPSWSLATRISDEVPEFTSTRFQLAT